MTTPRLFDGHDLCRCGCHAPGSNMMHFAACCHRPRQIPCDRGAIVDWLKPYLIDPEQYWIEITPEVFTEFAKSPDEWPGIGPDVPKLFGIHVVKWIVDYPRPLLHVVRTGTALKASAPMALVELVPVVLPANN